MYLVEALADVTAVDVVAPLLQYGVVGVVAAGGVLFARSAYGKAAAAADTAYKREQERADRLEQENRRLNELVIERVIPAVGAASRAAEQAAELLTAAQREREQLRLYAQMQAKRDGG